MMRTGEEWSTTCAGPRAPYQGRCPLGAGILVGVAGLHALALSRMDFCDLFSMCVMVYVDYRVHYSLSYFSVMRQNV